MSGTLNVRWQQDDQVAVIETGKYLDLSNSETLRVTVADLVQQGRNRIVIDLAKTKHMDSSGLAAVVSRIAVMRSSGGDLRLATVSKHIFEILKITNLDKIIKTFDDVSSAVASFDKP